MTTSRKVKSSIIAGLLGMVFAGSALASKAPEYANIDSVSLKDALVIAKNHTKAEPIWAERQEEMDQALYRIKLVDVQGKTFNAIVSATSGDIALSNIQIERDKDEILRNAGWLSGVNDGRLKSLATVVESTENEFGGQVYEIEIDEDHGIFTSKFAYEMKYVTSEGKKRSADVFAQ